MEIGTWVTLAVLLSAITVTYFALRKGTKNDIAELRTENAETRTELKANIAELRTEIKADMAELKADIRELRLELEADIRELGLGLEAEISHLNECVLALGINPKNSPNPRLRSNGHADVQSLRCAFPSSASRVHHLCVKKRGAAPVDHKGLT